MTSKLTSGTTAKRPSPNKPSPARASSPAAGRAPGDESSLTANGLLVKKLINATVGMSLVTLLALAAAALALGGALSGRQIAFSVDSRGVLTPAVPLTEAYLSESRVIAFADECIRRAWAHDFLHYESTIPLAQDCFTPGAADLFVQGLAPFVTTMTTKRMVMGSTIVRMPRVVQYRLVASVDGPVPHWDIEAEIGIFFEGKAERIPPSRNKVQMTIRRVPLQASPRGVQIDKFFVGPL